jgi:AraC-like DNA-binding protein
MSGLEPNSPGLFRCAAPGRMRHAPGELLTRHRHREPFAAVVLSGGYDEAGDTGRHRVQAGDVVFHGAFEAHLDRFGAPGAEVLVIPLPEGWSGSTLGSLADADAVARAAERDTSEALHLVASNVAVREPQSEDWPEALAAALRFDPSLSLADWADRIGLHRGSLSRGFAQVFGISPAAYRLSQRARRAIAGVVNTDEPLSSVAAASGFADQAHMTRAVRAVAGTPPAALRLRHR